MGRSAIEYKDIKKYYNLSLCKIKFLLIIVYFNSYIIFFNKVVLLYKFVFIVSDFVTKVLTKKDKLF